MMYSGTKEAVVDELVRAVKSYLINMLGRTAEEATADEFYKALCYAVRETTMINWLATAKTIAQRQARMIYYFSMEYLPGRLFMNNLTNLCSVEVVRIVLQRMNRNFRDIAEREDDPGLGNGGLGRLASCLLDSLATQHYPAQGYGLRYQYGIFEQQLWGGAQVEVPDCWLLNENPWEFRRDLRRVHVNFCGTATPSVNLHGDEIMELKDAEDVGALPYDFPVVGYSKESDFSVVSLRLWSTKDSPRNFLLQRYNAGRLDQAAENMTLTDVLYPSDNTEVGKRIRLKQEYLLVSASLQDIIRHHLAAYENFRLFVDKVRIQINDTHAALVVPELIRILTKDHDLPWQRAFEITQACTGYTNHTILSEALEQWDSQLFRYLLPRQYRIVERLNQEFCTSVRAKYPNNEEMIRQVSILEGGMVRMAHLAVVGSHKVNGVAKIHSEILKKSVFAPFYALFPNKFINITNGVTQRRWLLECNPELAEWITRRIGKGWITDFGQIRQLTSFAQDRETQEQFLLIKRRNKERFVEFFNRVNRIRDEKGGIVGPPPLLDIDALFDVQVKRIHEYKRQLLHALHLIMLYQEILDDPHTERVKRCAIMGGKAAAGYRTAKEVIRLFTAIGRKIHKEPAVAKLLRVVYLENYNVTRAEQVIPAADLSEQISTAGTEASGTGNMKLSMNGALTIGTRDGANVEMEEEVGSDRWPFAFGASSEKIAEMRANGSYQPRRVYEQNPLIKKAVDALADHTFAQTDEEHTSFQHLYRTLLEGDGRGPDPYFVLYDLQSYWDAQKKVEALYKEPEKWAEMVIYNIAGMGKFSSDRAVYDYAKLVWEIEPVPLDPDLLERARYDYASHNRCL